jgi:hypothetical protein
MEKLPASSRARKSCYEEAQIFQPAAEETEMTLGYEPKAINGRGQASTRFTVVGYPHVTSGTSDGNPISSRDASSLIRETEAIEASYFPVRGAYLVVRTPICNAGCINAAPIAPQA